MGAFGNDYPYLLSPGQSLACRFIFHADLRPPPRKFRSDRKRKHNSLIGKPIPDAEVYEAIGMVLADGTGLGRMQFTDAQIDLILSGMKKGIKTKAMPPDSLQSKIQAVMMQKMQLAREAERAEGSKLAAENKAKGKGFSSKQSEDYRILKKRHRCDPDHERHGQPWHLD